jgi:DNA-directed RNA polymerase I subunit RPA1
VLCASPTLVSISLQKVTPWNAKKLQEAIRNGADIHPGATHYSDSENKYKLQTAPTKRHGTAKKLPATRGSNSQPGKDPNCEFECKVVYRHLQDGDIVLVNRQVYILFLRFYILQH